MGYGGILFNIADSAVDLLHGRGRLVDNPGQMVEVAGDLLDGN